MKEIIKYTIERLHINKDSMKSFNHYINEKLKIDRNTDIGNSDRYIVLMSDGSENPIINVFSDYDKAVDFSKKSNLNYYEGFKTKLSLIKELKSLMLDVWYHNKDYDELKKFVEENKIKKLFDKEDE